MEARIYLTPLSFTAKDPYDALQRIVRGDPSRRHSPVINQLAKPIPLAQSVGIRAVMVESKLACPLEARGRAIRYNSGRAQGHRASGFPLLSLTHMSEH